MFLFHKKGFICLYHWFLLNRLETLSRLNVWTLVVWRMSESSPTKFGVKKVSWRRKGCCFFIVQKIMLWLGVPRATNNRQHEQQQPTSTSTTKTNNKNIHQPPPLINLPFLKKKAPSPPKKKKSRHFQPSDGFRVAKTPFPFSGRFGPGAWRSPSKPLRFDRQSLAVRVTSENRWVGEPPQRARCGVWKPWEPEPIDDGLDDFG